MRLLIAVVLAAAGALAGADEVAFNHVTVVDVVEGKLVPDQAVRISAKRIVDVMPAADARIPPGTRIIDATGQFLIPGLWDMHAHYFDVDTPGSPEVTFPLSVAHGVTGARDVGGYLDLLLSWRAEVDAGRIVGPRIVGTGPLIDGVPVVYPPMSVVARTPDDGRRIVDALAARGGDFVKAYEMLRPDTFFAIVDQAKKRGLPVVAHVPLTVLATEASDAGVKSFEHLRNIELACSRDADALLAERKAMVEAGAGRVGMELRTEIHWAQRMRALDTHDPERCTALLRKLAANRSWQAPTLFLGTRDAFRPDRRETVRDTLRWVPDVQRADWEAWSQRMSKLAPEAAAARKRHAEWSVQLVRRMKEEGVGLLAGTDISVQWMVPGAGLHEELGALVEAGLTPLDALRSATWNAARYFEKTDDRGTVARGHLADLVLLEGDPLADIRNARRIRAVVADGRYLDRPALDALLATAERTARTAEHALIHRPPPSLHAMEPARVPNGWRLASPAEGAFSARVDTVEKHSGRASALLECATKDLDAFGTLMQTFRADEYRGRRVRLSGHLRSRDVEHWAALWMRVDGLEASQLAYDNMSKRPVRGDTEWSSYQIVLDVPRTAALITYGALLGGSGRLWVDDLAVEVVGEDVPTTDMKEPVGQTKTVVRADLPARPVNMGFEE